MTDQSLTELLDHAAERVPVGPPPVADMVSGAERALRRRTLKVSLVGAAAVAAIAGGTAVLSTPGGSTTPQPPTTSPSSVAPPPSTRLMGVGHAAIAVPRGWGTNATRCGVPQKHTVVIDVGAVDACATKRPEGVDSVAVTPGDRGLDFEVDETGTVDGVSVERQATTCEGGGLGGSRVCSGTVYIPSMNVAFRAESSTSAAEVDRILERIQVVPDRIAVPGYQTVALDEQGKSGEKYLQALRETGLTADIRTRRVPAVDPGYVLEVAPRPGTMLTPGAVVAVAVVAEPGGPADEVRVGVNSIDAAEEEHDDLDDAQIRAGATLRLEVGDRVWAYADGKRAHTLAGELDGRSLTVDDWQEGPNYPHSWVAVATGRTEVTLTVMADGEPVVLGVVTVHVT